jgi:hypothetical protein
LSELLSYLLFPLARLISRNTPSKLRTALAKFGKTMTTLEVALAVYSISLRYLPAGEFLDKINLPKPWQSITDPWDLLIILSVVVIFHHAGGKVAMNLKFLLQPTIDKIREEGLEEGREEERKENTRAMESWLEKQIRAGKINEDVELPVFGEDGKGKDIPDGNVKEDE